MNEPGPSVHSLMSRLKILGQTLLSIRARCTEHAENNHQEDASALGVEVQTVIQRWRTLETSLEGTLTALLRHVGEPMEDEPVDTLQLSREAETTMTSHLSEPQRYENALRGMEGCLKSMTEYSNNVRSLLDGSSTSMPHAMAQSVQHIRDLASRTARSMDRHLDTLWTLRFKHGVAGQDGVPQHHCLALHKFFVKAKKLRYHTNRIHLLLQHTWDCKCQSSHLTDLLLQQAQDDEMELHLAFHPSAETVGHRSWMPKAVRITPEYIQSAAAKSDVQFDLSTISSRHSVVNDRLECVARMSSLGELKHLCAKLKKDSKSSEVLGIFGDEQESYRARLMSPGEVPENLIGDHISTLNELLKSPRNTNKLRLVERYKLALALASSHLRLHPTTWLAAGWECRRIIFPVKDSRIFLDKPFLRCGSERSPDQTSIFEQDIATQTLGIMLLELYFGETLDEYRRRNGHSPFGGPAEDVKDADKWFTSTEIEADAEFQQTFKSIVKWCLGSKDIDSTDDKWRWQMQHEVIEPLNDMLRSTVSIRAANFDRTAAQLRSLLEQELLSCDLDQDEPFDFEAEFCPEQALAGFTQRNRPLIREMYKQHSKVQTSADLPELFGRDVIKLQKEQREFWRGLSTTESLRQILATLILTKSDPVSRTWSAAWQNLVEACRDDNHQIRSWTFPLDDESLKTYFGQYNRAEALSFRSMQYCFCPLKIEKGKQSKGLQIANDSKFRLPFKSKRIISEGAQGRVFRVKVAAGYLFNSDKELAMKDTIIADARQDEWRKTMWMLKQVMHHDCIMRAHASLKIGKRVMIFYDLAKFDLLHYMRYANAPGPSGARERKEMFRLIVEVADALKHLHCHLKRFPYPMVCFHKDIKAENILVCERSDRKPGLILKITDFGISSLEIGDSPSNVDTDVKAITSAKTCLSLRDHTVRTILGDGLPHSAPESRNGGLVSASADVWAYGTVFSEYLAWLYGGASSLDHFRKCRAGTHGDEMSYQLPRLTASNTSRGQGSKHQKGLPILREGVKDFFEYKIRTVNNEQGLELIVDSWLLLQDHILVLDPRQRSRIEFICDKMEQIAIKLDNDRMYS